MKKKTLKNVRTELYSLPLVEQTEYKSKGLWFDHESWLLDSTTSSGGHRPREVYNE